MDLEQYKWDERLKELPFEVVNPKDFEISLAKKPYQVTNKNKSWKTALFFGQTILLELPKMCNITYVYFDKFEMGCEISIQIAEFGAGPYTEVCKPKFFARASLRRIKLGSLPCRYVRIKIIKGVYIDPKNIKLIGFASEDAAKLFGEDTFPLLVTFPQRLMFD